MPPNPSTPTGVCPACGGKRDQPARFFTQPCIHSFHLPPSSERCGGSECPNPFCNEGQTAEGPCEFSACPFSDCSPTEQGERFEGHPNRECGEHRTMGARAYCYDCSEKCSPSAPCRGCELPQLRSALSSLRTALERAGKDIAAIRRQIETFEEQVETGSTPDPQNPDNPIPTFTAYPDDMQALGWGRVLADMSLEAISSALSSLPDPESEEQ